MTNHTYEIADGSTTFSGLAAGDTITFGTGLTFDTFAFLKDGDDLLVFTNIGATIRLVDQFLGAPLIHGLIFGSGDVIPLNVNNAIFGTSHNATLTGTTADDTIYGGIDRNTINGGDGNDTIYAGHNNDIINGGNGDDIIYAGAGTDHIIASAGNDIINGGDGHDFVDYRNSTSGVTVKLLNGTATDGTNTDTLISIEEVIGSNFADKIIGSHNEDAISGEGGDDILKGRQGDDWIDGGAGNDIVNGNKGDDTLFGGSGDDIIHGGFGNDIIHGQSGQDTLHGRTGADTFVFDSSALSDVDTILDFTLSDNDAVDISALLHAYDPLTDLITDFVQITDNGTDSFLSVDQDGAGTVLGFQQIAQLNNITGLDEAALEINGNLITA
jgi:Ca2+-binding RTX toxin-like protein